MSIALITGSCGLVGSEAARFYADKGYTVIGLDNDMRRTFFGESASTDGMRRRLLDTLVGYQHRTIDIRDTEAINALFSFYSDHIGVIIHTAAQPSHDWAASDPLTDFSVNAVGTLNLLQAAREHCPNAPFIFTSTNKVYGDRPNRYKYQELDTRWELPDFEGFDENVTVDQTLHSLFGCSKLAADVLVQEYGRNFGMKTVCFRCGCLTGPHHAGVEAHGFLAYLMRCAVEGREYRIFGHKSKQVRDNLHSADLVNAFWEYTQNPRSGEVYNLGGGRKSHCSLLEAVRLCELITGHGVKTQYVEQARTGDHIWYVSNNGKFQHDYPAWSVTYNVPQILEEIYAAHRERAVSA